MIIRSSSTIHHGLRLARAVTRPAFTGPQLTRAALRPGAHAGHDPKCLTARHGHAIYCVALPPSGCAGSCDAQPRCPTARPPRRRHRRRPGRRASSWPRWAGTSGSARERRGLARKAVSQSAGVSERYLAQLEAGEGNASVLLLRSVARALEMPLTELIDAARELGRAAPDPPLSRSACRRTGSRTSCSG